MERSLSNVLRALKLSSCVDLFRPHWDESVRTLPASGPPYLDPDRIAANVGYAHLHEDVLLPLKATAHRVRIDENLRLLSWHCYRLLFDHLDYSRCREWPDLEHLMRGRTGLFYFLIALEMVPLTREKHRELGIADAITRVNCENLNAHLDRFMDATGHYGTEQRLLMWLRNHTTGILHRLGRFQYMRKPFRGQLRAYRHRHTGRVLALAHAGLVCSPEGWLLTGLTSDSPGAWITGGGPAADGQVCGHLVSPWGCILKQTASLALSEWELALSPEDFVLEIHIPPGGGMTPEASVASMRDAVAFFRKQFPDQPFRGLSCLSWVFNPRFGEILPPSANLRRVAEEVYLFPIPSGRKNGLYFIFGQDDIDPATAPRDTSIRRTLIRELEEGHPLLSGGMFILTEDLQDFGTQQYRRGFSDR
jgi:hypothetical protein